MMPEFGRTTFCVGFFCSDDGTEKLIAEVDMPFVPRKDETVHISGHVRGVPGVPKTKYTVLRVEWSIMIISSENGDKKNCEAQVHIMKALR